VTVDVPLPTGVLEEWWIGEARPPLGDGHACGRTVEYSSHEVEVEVVLGRPDLVGLMRRGEG
jgi:hypothetical protein